MRPSSITVVICAYTLARWELLKASIESVLAQKLQPGDLLVVVDHNPELRNRLTEAYPSLRVVDNEHTPGLSGARNSGLDLARGEIVAFLDDDAQATPDWLEELMRGFDDPAVQGVGGLIEAWWDTGRPRWFPDEFDWVVGCTYRGMPSTVAEIRNPIGANMAFRRELVARIGGFNESIGRTRSMPLGGEETELSIRAARSEGGARFLYWPRAAVCHHVPAARGTWRYFVRRCYAEGVSKAAICRVVGSTAGLASERGYATRTLPRGMTRGIRDATRGDWWGLARAFAISLGLVVTALGYVLGSTITQHPATLPTR